MKKERWRRFYRDSSRELPWEKIEFFAAARRFLEGLTLATMTAALDVGCGRGNITAQLQELTGLPFLGIDFAQEAVEEARRRHASRGAELSFEVADVRSLPFDDGAFDLICDRGCIHGLPSVQDRQIAVSEIHRVLKPGGRFLLVAMGADPARPWLSSLSSLLHPGVRHLGAREVQGLTRDCFEPEDLAYKVVSTPISHRFLPLSIPVNFQIHLLQKPLSSTPRG